jgi:hypothetical protein
MWSEVKVWRTKPSIPRNIGFRVPTLGQYDRYCGLPVTRLEDFSPAFVTILGMGYLHFFSFNLDDAGSDARAPASGDRDTVDAGVWSTSTYF